MNSTSHETACNNHHISTFCLTLHSHICEHTHHTYMSVRIYIYMYMQHTTLNCCLGFIVSSITTP